MRCSICDTLDDGIHFDKETRSFTICVGCQASVDEALLDFLEEELDADDAEE